MIRYISRLFGFGLLKRKDEKDSVVKGKNLDSIINSRTGNIVKISYYDLEEYKEKEVMLLTTVSRNGTFYVRNKDSYENSRYILWTSTIERIEEKINSDYKTIYYNENCKRKQLDKLL